MSAAEPARAGGARARSRASLRALHDCGERLPASFDSFRIVETYAATAARARRRGARPPSSERTRAAARIEAALAGPEHDAGALPQRPAGRQLPRAARRHPDRRLGVRGDGRPLLRPRATSRSTTSSTTTGEAALLDAYFGEPPAPARLAALRLMRFMSDFREAMWGVRAERRSPSIDFDFAGYADEALRRGCARRRPTPASRPGWRRRVAPRAELPDSARCVIIGGGVGGASIAYHLAELGWEDVVLLERSQLTSGSTFHSAGLVGQLRGSVSLTKMMMHSVDLYRRLGGRVRVRPRLGRVRRHPPRLERGADGGAAPPGRLGEDLRAAAGADLGRGGEGAVPADVDRRACSAPPGCRPTATSTPPSSPTRSPTAPAAAAARSSPTPG